MSDFRAVAAVARIIRNNHGGDPDITAAEILTALRGHGWRPTPATPQPPDWRAPATEGTPPTDSYREARRKLTTRTDTTP